MATTSVMTHKREEEADFYATAGDFKELREIEIASLFRLAFLIVGNLLVAEECVIAAIDNCANEGHVPEEWATLEFVVS